jgi:signal peptidase I
MRRGGGREPLDKEDEEEEEDEEKTDFKASALGLLRDVTIAVIIMVILIGSMWGYTQNWPPMVVVESESMMHAEDSEVGVIDTGDLVLVKKIGSRGDITTYFVGKKQDYKTYGEYGDVIIYKKDGGKETPVIHRAILWLEYNKTATDADNRMPKVGHFDIPELGRYDLTGQIQVAENFPAYNKDDQDDNFR